jgi:hypothetical protein
MLLLAVFCFDKSQRTTLASASLISPVRDKIVSPQGTRHLASERAERFLEIGDQCIADFLSARLSGSFPQRPVAA